MPRLPPSTLALPPAALPHSHVTFVKDFFGHIIPITSPLLTPAALLICALRLEAGTPDPTDVDMEEHHLPTTQFAEWGPDRGSEQYPHDWMRLITYYSPWNQGMIRRRVFTPGMMTGTWVGCLFVSHNCLEYFILELTFVFIKQIPREQFDSILYPHPFTPVVISPLIHVCQRPMQFDVW